MGENFSSHIWPTNDDRNTAKAFRSPEKRRHWRFLDYLDSLLYQGGEFAFPRRSATHPTRRGLRLVEFATASMRSENIHQVVRILRKEVKQWPVPAIANYVETPFTVLVSCILSLRTQ